MPLLHQKKKDNNNQEKKNTFSQLLFNEILVNDVSIEIDNNNKVPQFSIYNNSRYMLPNNSTFLNQSLDIC